MANLDVFVFTILISLLCTVYTSQIPEKIDCADDQCQTIISHGRAQTSYSGNEPGMASFRKGDNIDVYSKQCKESTGIWGIKVNGQFGFVHSKFIKESSVESPKPYQCVDNPFLAKKKPVAEDISPTSTVTTSESLTEEKSDNAIVVSDETEKTSSIPQEPIQQQTLSGQDGPSLPTQESEKVKVDFDATPTPKFEPHSTASFVSEVPSSSVDQSEPLTEDTVTKDNKIYLRTNGRDIYIGDVTPSPVAEPGSPATEGAQIAPSSSQPVSQSGAPEAGLVSDDLSTESSTVLESSMTSLSSESAVPTAAINPDSQSDSLSRSSSDSIEASQTSNIAENGPESVDASKQSVEAKSLEIDKVPEPSAVDSSLDIAKPTVSSVDDAIKISTSETVLDSTSSSEVPKAADENVNPSKHSESMKEEETASKIPKNHNADANKQKQVSEEQPHETEDKSVEGTVPSNKDVASKSSAKEEKAEESTGTEPKVDIVTEAENINTGATIDKSVEKEIIDPLEQEDSAEKESPDDMIETESEEKTFANDNDDDDEAKVVDVDEGKKKEASKEASDGWFSKITSALMGSSNSDQATEPSEDQSSEPVSSTIPNTNSGDGTNESVIDTDPKNPEAATSSILSSATATQSSIFVGASSELPEPANPDPYNVPNDPESNKNFENGPAPSAANTPEESVLNSGVNSMEFYDQSLPSQPPSSDEAASTNTDIPSPPTDKVRNYMFGHRHPSVPETETSSETNTGSLHKPPVDQISEPSVENTSQSIVDAGTNPTIETTSPSVADQNPDPTTESSDLQIVDKVPEPCTESIFQSFFGKGPEPTTESASEPVIDQVPETSTDSTNEPVMDPSLQTNPVTESLNEQPELDPPKKPDFLKNEELSETNVDSETIQRTVTNIADETVTPPVEEATTTESQPKYVDSIRPSDQGMSEVVPEWLQVTADLDNQGVSSRVVIITAISGILVLVLLIAFFTNKTRSTELSLTAKLCNLDQKLFAMTTERNIMRDELEKSKERVTHMEEDLMDSSESTPLKEQLEEANNTIEEQKKTIVSLEEELSSATEAGLELNQMLSEYLTSQNQNDSVQTSIEALQQQLNSQQQSMSALHDDLEKKTSQNKEMKKELEALTKKNEVFEKETKQMKNDLKRSEETNKSLKEKLEMKSEESEQLEIDNTNFKVQLGEAKNKVTFLSKDLTDLKEDYDKIKYDSVEKEMELTNLREAMKNFEMFASNDDDDEGETESSEKREEFIAKLLDVTKLQASLKIITEEKDLLTIKYKNEVEARKDHEAEVSSMKGEYMNMERKMDEAMQEKQDAVNKLEILSKYFKDKEAQLQKELGLQEAKVLQSCETAESAGQKAIQVEQNIVLYKDQYESLKKEMDEMERSYKNQIAVQEKKAHENWLAARAAERKLDDLKTESGILRNKLTLVEQEKASLVSLMQNDSIVKPQPQRNSSTSQNGDLSSTMFPSQESASESVLTAASPVSHNSTGDLSGMESPRGRFVPLDRPSVPPMPFPPMGMPPMFDDRGPLPPLGMPPHMMPMMPPPFDGRTPPPFERRSHGRMSPDRQKRSGSPGHERMSPYSDRERDQMSPASDRRSAPYRGRSPPRDRNSPYSDHDRRPRSPNFRNDRSPDRYDRDRSPPSHRGREPRYSPRYDRGPIDRHYSPPPRDRAPFHPPSGLPAGHPLKPPPRDSDKSGSSNPRTPKDITPLPPNPRNSSNV